MTTVRHLVKGLGPGGAERLLVTQIIAEAGPFEHEVAYLVPAKDHLVAELTAASVEVRCLDGGSGVGWVRRLRRLLRDHPTDLVHVHSPAVAAVTRVVVRTLRRSQRPAVVGTEHNRWPRHHRLTRLANRLTIRLESATIAVSDDVASTIRGARPGQVRTIVHGIDLDAVRATADRAGARAEIGAGDDDVLVVCVANLRREKALDELVAAARRAIADQSSLRFALVGQGPLADDVDRWISEAGVGERFVALGYRTDATRVLSGADVFTLSSHHEGLPVAVMEALALGVPVVATAAGGIPDAVADAGIVTPVAEPERLADAYATIAGDADKRAELAALAERRADAFSVRRAIEEIRAVYETATRAGDAPNAAS